LSSKLYISQPDRNFEKLRTENKKRPKVKFSVQQNGAL